MAFRSAVSRRPGASGLAAILFLLLLPAAVSAAPPPAPYYSVQTGSIDGHAGALAAVRALADHADVRAEDRDGYYVVRVGALASEAAAAELRLALLREGHAGARVVKVTRPVGWLLADGSVLPPPADAMTTAADDAASGDTTAAAIADAAPPAGSGDVPGTAPAAIPTALPAPARAAVIPPADAPADAGLVEGHAVHLPDAGGAANWSSTLVALDQLGNADGVMLEGDRGVRELFFPMPAGVPVARAALALDVQFGELVIASSTLQFRVNGTVRAAIRRGEGGQRQRVEIPLTARDLELDYARLGIDYALLVNPDVCFSRQLAGAYARIAPGSGLSVVSSDPLPRTVRAAWSLLPREVVVAARPRGLSPAEFQALFSVATLLHREGHAVRYAAWSEGRPTDAHIVLAPAARHARGGDELEQRANLRIVRSGDGRHARAFILIDSARPLPAAGMLRQPWRGPSGAGLVDVSGAADWPQPRERGDVVRLSRLGFADSERAFTLSTQWGIGLPFGPLGAGQRPARAALEVYGPRLEKVRAPTVVSAYFNDRLVYSTTLRNDGRKEVLEFDLPRVQLRARNNLKVVAQRDGEGDDCRRSPAAYPLSISPDSVIETQPLNETPSTFAELVPWQRSLELHVARDALDAPARVIPALVSLGDQFWPDVPPPLPRFFAPGEAPAPAGPFLVVGDAGWRPQAYVAFDQGRVQVRSNATGEPVTLLDFASDSDGAVLQMVKAGGHGGAWLKAAPGYANLAHGRMLLEDEQVALLGPRGVQLGMRIGATRDYRVDYPDAKGWFPATGAWRTMAFAVAWIAVAGLLLWLYLKTRRHGGE
jgi:hypothetical protein